jgi:hypothetical protein
LMMLSGPPLPAAPVVFPAMVSLVSVMLPAL